MRPSRRPIISFNRLIGMSARGRPDGLTLLALSLIRKAGRGNDAEFRVAAGLHRPWLGGRADLPAISAHREAPLLHCRRRRAGYVRRLRRCPMWVVYVATPPRLHRGTKSMRSQTIWDHVHRCQRARVRRAEEPGPIRRRKHLSRHLFAGLVLAPPRKGGEGRRWKRWTAARPRRLAALRPHRYSLPQLMIGGVERGQHAQRTAERAP